MKFSQKGMMHGFKWNVLFEMHVFEWLPNLVYSCTNTIFLHFFAQSANYGCLKDVSMVKVLIYVSQAQEGILKFQGCPMSSFIQVM